MNLLFGGIFSVVAHPESRNAVDMLAKKAVDCQRDAGGDAVRRIGTGEQYSGTARALKGERGQASSP